MTTPFTIDLTISLPDGGRLAKQLLNLYFEDMPADIDEAAFKLCDSNHAVQAQKFTGLILKRADGWPSPEGSLKVFARLSVSGEDAAFIEQVIAEYMKGFPGYLKQSSGRYFSGSGSLPDISLQPTDWKAEVLQA
jgi:hypothetical protein